MANPLLPFLACAAVGAAVERPNVVLICVDDLKPNLGCFGDAHAQTPNIDRLARHGVVFTRAYVQQAVCAPSRHSLMTGLRSDQLGIYDLATDFRRAAPDAVTLTQAFMRAGWHAEGVGKIYHRRGNAGDDPASWSIPHVFPADDTPKERTGGPGLPPGAKAKKPAPDKVRGMPWAWPDCPDAVTRDARTAAHAVERLGILTGQDKPFFLAVGFSKPHLPFIVPKRYWDLYDPARLPLPEADAKPPSGAPTWAGNLGFGELRNYTDIQEVGALTPEQARTMVHGYYAATSFVDAQIGMVLDELEKRDLIRNTIVVLWGDHGWHLGDHGWWCKHTNYEQATRNPVIVCAPGLTRGASSPALAATIDLYPTLCSLAGVPAPPGLPGTDLTPVLRDPTTSVQDAVVSVYPRHVEGAPVLGRALRTTRWRYVEWRRFDAARTLVAEELYDLEQDPGELRSLAGQEQHRALMDGFQAQLAKLPPPKPQFTAPVKPDNK